MHTHRKPSAVAKHVDNALWLFAFIVPVLTATSWLVYAHRAARGDAFDSRPLYAQNDQFHDLTNYIGKTSHLYRGSAALGAGARPIYNYLPTGAFALKAIIYMVPGHAVRTFVTLGILIVLLWGLATYRSLGRTPLLRLAALAAISATALFSFPIWTALDRGNIEFEVCALSGAGLWLIARKRGWAGAILVGVAGSIKPWPLVLVLILLRRREYKPAILSLGTTSLLTLAALIVLGPNPWKAYQDLKPGVENYVNAYLTNLTRVDDERFEHSLFDGMKSLALTIEMGGINPDKALTEVPSLQAEAGGWYPVHWILRVYPLLAFAILALIVKTFYSKPFLNQATALAISITLLPSRAADYTLLALYVPFAMFLIYLTRTVETDTLTLSSRSIYLTMLLYALVFSPLSFFRIYSADVRLLLLIALLWVTARSPMPCSFFGDEVVAHAEDFAAA